MTVLQLEETADEGNNRHQPPRKRLCLSATRQDNNPPWLLNAGSEYDQNVASSSKFGDMVIGGYEDGDGYMQGNERRRSSDETTASYASDSSIPPIAPLLNLGNTCFLNSVLYTLRFAPSFLHKLHHLHADCATFFKLINGGKDRAYYSLGRSMNRGMITGSTMELRMYQVIDKLHALYADMNYKECKDRSDPLQPNTFMQALREVNSIFEGNQQHDAHELLVCLLSLLREACEVLYQQNMILDKPSSSASSAAGSAFNKFSGQVRKSLKFGTKTSRTAVAEKTCSNNNNKNIGLNGESSSSMGDESMSILGVGNLGGGGGHMEAHFNDDNNLFEDFQGVSLLRTTCLECEHVTERKEMFCDICVPIQSKDTVDDVEDLDAHYRSIIITEEYLMDCNKYWCDECSRYNEARRRVTYGKLPRLLTLHLKRFSTFGCSVSKVTDYMPTPLRLSCFCEDCTSEGNNGVGEEDVDEEEEHRNARNGQQRHPAYALYAIIMHLGSSIASGHYVAYVRTYDNLTDYAGCLRDKPKTSSLSRGFSMNHGSASSGSGLPDKTGILRFFKSVNKSGGVSNGSGEGNLLAGQKAGKATCCKGMDCCSIRCRMDIRDGGEEEEPVWLECDDDSVKPLRHCDLMQMLSKGEAKNSAITPYLLFYAREE